MPQSDNGFRRGEIETEEITDLHVETVPDETAQACIDDNREKE